MVWTSLFAPKGLPKPVLDRLATGSVSRRSSDQELVAHFLKKRRHHRGQARGRAPLGWKAARQRPKWKSGAGYCEGAGVQPE